MDWLLTVLIITCCINYNLTRSSKYFLQVLRSSRRAPRLEVEVQVLDGEKGG